MYVYNWDKEAGLYKREKERQKQRYPCIHVLLNSFYFPDIANQYLKDQVINRSLNEYNEEGFEYKPGFLSEKCLCLIFFIKQFNSFIIRVQYKPPYLCIDIDLSNFSL